MALSDLRIIALFLFTFFTAFFLIGVIALEKLSGHLCPSASYLSLQKIIFNNHYSQVKTFFFS